MIVNRVSGFMNLWVSDPTVCMMTDRIAGCFFAIAFLIYLRSLLRGSGFVSKNSSGSL